MSNFVERIIRAIKLDVHLYEEVEADDNATGQAIGIVVLSSIAAGIGTFEYGRISGIFLGTIGALIGWFIWAYLTYYIGTRILPEPTTRATPIELMRTIGFSSSPGLIRVIGIISPLREIVMLGSAIWMLIAMVIAVRQALDYKSTFRAVGVCVIGWIIQIIVFLIMLSILGIFTRSL